MFFLHANAYACILKVEVLEASVLSEPMFFFEYFQRRNVRIVYDAIGTLADAVGGELNQVNFS